MDRLALNASIEALIESEGADSDAREVLARYGMTLPKSKTVELHGLSVQSSQGGMSGHTPGHGSVELHDRDRLTTTEFTRGSERQRIGYFKIWREPASGGENWIVIADYWKADLGTGSLTELSRQWTLALNQKGEACWFAERGMRSVFCIPFGIGALRFNREILCEKWGPSPGREHHRGYTFNLVVFR